MPAAEDIFRGEALEHQQRYQGNRGALLRISPIWSRWTYWLLLAVVGAGVLYVVFGSVHEYATGPAVLHVDGRSKVTATRAGIIDRIEVRPRERVAAQDLAATVEGAEIRAPRAGTVSDVRVRQGQRVQAGDVLFTVQGDDAAWSVIAMLPGHYRPFLHPGIGLRVAMSGYREVYRDLTIDSVSDEVVGPSEVQRALGAEIGDAVQVRGAVVLVRAHLPSTGFAVKGSSYPYYEGLEGTAEARVRSERIVFALVPGLRLLFEPS